ncbi:MAG: hypothetical protein JL50_21375 [Peptococcaceae bacterium BICA1-7]|nr:MAG: hypothetical protein JL50_21375 [Peptococcaceae bacterium BICA1-7]HBV97119.1 hypothetical protein [Desulfotomaculum sp.]
MKKIYTLLLGDIKNIYRDTLLLVTVLAPFILAVLMKYGVPRISSLLMQKTGFDLTPHYSFIMSYLIIFTPLMLGTLAGFIVLDERDENLLSYFSVTPLSKAGYLLYRTALPTAASFLFTFLALRFANLAGLNYTGLIPVVLMASLEAPVVALFLGAFAANKVEGLAYTKGLGILYIAPVIGYLVKSKLQLLAFIIPTFWVTKGFLESSQPGLTYWLYIGPGLLIHLLLIKYFIKKFRAKVD